MNTASVISRAVLSCGFFLSAVAFADNNKEIAPNPSHVLNLGFDRLQWVKELYLVNTKYLIKGITLVLICGFLYGDWIWIGASF